MTSINPDITIANNPYCLIHAGPISDNVKDPKHELLIFTRSGNQTVHNENGTRTDYVLNRFDEVSGYNITQPGDIARTIVADNGDIHIVADNGDIYLKARNIYIEANGDKEGGKSNGSVLVKGNGQVNISGEDEAKISSGSNLSLIGKSKIGLNSNQTISIGKFLDGGPSATGDFISQFMASGWSGFLETAAKTLV